MTALWRYRLFTQPVDRSRSDGLDALRFFLALWVLLAHALGWSVYTGALNAGSILDHAQRVLIWLFQRSGETHPAVLAFIVLSGYCIHRNGFRLHSSFSLKAFGIRRSFRILPVYLLASSVGIALYFVNIEIHEIAGKALSGTENINPWCILVKLTGISSFFPSLYTCSFQGNAPLTTAMVEIWLYVLYAAVAWVVTRGIALKYVVIGLAIFWIGTLGYVLLNSGYTGWWHNGSFISFALYWWLGAVFAEYGPQQTARNKRQTKFLITIGAVLIVISSFSASLILIELRKIGLVLLLALVIRRIDCGWHSPLLAKAGQTGYDIYALHAPLLIFLLLNGEGLILSVCLILIASIVCHLIFERPLLEYGKRLALSVSR